MNQQTANKVYDRMKEDRIYMRKEMDCNTEWLEAVSPGKRRQLVDWTGYAMTLDEWAAEFNVTTSELLEMLRMAQLASERSGLDEDEQHWAEYEAYCMAEVEFEEA